MSQEYGRERYEFLGAMNCWYVYDVRQCKTDAEEENYNIYSTSDTTRLAIHVGNRTFHDGETVFRSFYGDLFGSQKAELEFLLDRYKVRNLRRKPWEELFDSAPHNLNLGVAICWKQGLNLQPRRYHCNA